MSSLQKIITSGSLNSFATAVRDRFIGVSGRIDVVEQSVSSMAGATHSHVIADVSGLSASLTSLQNEIDALDLILQADDSSLDTAQERLTELKRLAGLIGSLGIDQIDGLRAELNSLTDGLSDEHHTHSISDVTGLSSDLSSMQGEIDAIELILSADDANFDTAQERLTELKRLAGLIGSLGIDQIDGLRAELNSLVAATDASTDDFAAILATGGSYASSAAAKSGGLVVGDTYWNTATNSVEDVT